MVATRYIRQRMVVGNNVDERWESRAASERNELADRAVTQALSSGPLLSVRTITNYRHVNMTCAQWSFLQYCARIQ
jgi:hypothetical protein